MFSNGIGGSWQVANCLKTFRKLGADVSDCSGNILNAQKDSDVARPGSTRACGLPSTLKALPSTGLHQQSILNRMIPLWIKPKLVAVLIIIAL